ncbi:hypothetical protein AHAS_Ahas02G0019800 [Arachis hypogaea]
MLTFDMLANTEETYTFKMKDLLKLFYMVWRWDKTERSETRRIWLECYGVPLHAWSTETFTRLGDQWSEAIHVTIGANGFDVLVKEVGKEVYWEECFLEAMEGDKIGILPSELNEWNIQFSNHHYESRYYAQTKGKEISMGPAVNNQEIDSDYTLSCNYEAQCLKNQGRKGQNKEGPIEGGRFWAVQRGSFGATDNPTLLNEETRVEEPLARLEKEVANVACLLARLRWLWRREDEASSRETTTTQGRRCAAQGVGGGAANGRQKAGDDVRDMYLADWSFGRDNAGRPVATGVEEAYGTGEGIGNENQAVDETDTGLNMNEDSALHRGNQIWSREEEMAENKEVWNWRLN